ncbi:dystrotelin isoform X1 [Solea senegalensis]|uniref:Dystrotelin isoform X1 n=2 Tax=Solea senegalensis TaxID=28829 RepID=A0AAV6PM03_SOLSE|nr:dystrotelin isoform X1 [Solea senegalensis]
MDFNVTESLNEIGPCVYRVSMKLLSLQKLCHLDIVSSRHIMVAVQAVGGAQRQQEVELKRENMIWIVKRMFDSVSQEVPGHMIMEALEETSDLILTTFERASAGSLSVAFLQTCLIALSSDDLMTKYRALTSMCQSRSGSVSRSALWCLLNDLSQVPATVQEGVVFGDIDMAVSSCFNRVLTPTVNVEHVLSWLQTEPCLLLWLPTLYRLSVSQNVRHNVRCHTCKTFPISGLRYRCLKCVNVHVCQSCFLNEQQSKKHKRLHPLMEYCTQPTWRETVSSLVRSARFTLLPRRLTQREAESRKWEEPVETQNRAPPPSAASPRSVDTVVRHSHSPTPLAEPPRCRSSKGQQTDETPTCQEETKMIDITNLQQDKWLLEQEMWAWRITVQSEQSILEDRCSEMEVAVKTLRQQNISLEGALTQALNKMEAEQHMTHTDVTTETDDIMLTSDHEVEEEEDEEELLLIKEETPSPTIHWGSTSSQEDCEEEEPEDHGRLCQPIREEEEPEERGRQEEVDEEEDDGKCSPEDLIQRTVYRLKTELETDRQTGYMKWAELVEAAEQVGGAVHFLVDTVMNTY